MKGVCLPARRQHPKTAKGTTPIRSYLRGSRFNNGIFMQAVTWGRGKRCELFFVSVLLFICEEALFCRQTRPLLRRSTPSSPFVYRSSLK
jgi:hypothetical protein